MRRAYAIRPYENWKKNASKYFSTHLIKKYIDPSEGCQSFRNRKMRKPFFIGWRKEF